MEGIFQMNENKQLKAMYYWAIENNLEREFTDEILNNDRLENIILNKALFKRFAYFVLEHSDAVNILYEHERRL